MSHSRHFILSFATSIFFGTVCAIVTIQFQDRLLERGYPGPLLVMVSFVLGYLIVRHIFKNFVAVTCPHCKQHRGYPFPHRGDRFRCHDCGMDF